MMVEGTVPAGRPKKTWDAQDHVRYRSEIRPQPDPALSGKTGVDDEDDGTHIFPSSKCLVMSNIAELMPVSQHGVRPVTYLDSSWGL